MAEKPISEKLAEALKKVVEEEEKTQYFYDVKKAIAVALAEDPDLAWFSDFLEKISPQSPEDIKIVKTSPDEFKLILPLCIRVNGKVKCEKEGVVLEFKKNVTGPVSFTIKKPE